ncbi:MAG: hypothetical protein NC417_04975 [Candidatus Gastranaerophilales bacterium]|nr:hypothetical protein [Candidatus Gastranaerophilales bacterium]
MKNHKNRKVTYMAIISSLILLSEPVLTAWNVQAAENDMYLDYLAGTVNRTDRKESEYTVIEIRSEADLAELAENCTLDTWSQDKYVKLMNDISLQEYRNLSIPSFDGIFDGAGYRITNLKIETKGSAAGLFRYVQENGVVKNLSVEGRVTPEGSQSQAGGIVGVNYGRIADCSFSGCVEGADEIGGIAGVNEADGEIRRCANSAMIIGNHSTGGIVGNNHGTLNNCSNSGDINTRGTEVSYDLEDITVENLEDLNSTSNVAAHIDSGGVAGISDGKIYYCSNSGTVGYTHVGYNVGGIVGRLHQGYLQSCTNTGHVLGRKDVGGIAGQMEPFLEVKYLNDKLQELDRETDRFLDMLEALNDDLDHYGDRTISLTKNITASLRNANAAGGNLLGAANEVWYLYNQELAGLSGDLRNLSDDLGKQSTTEQEVTVSGNDWFQGENGNITIQVPDDRAGYEAALRRFGDNAGSHLDNITSGTNDRLGGITDNLNTFNAEMEAAGNDLEQLSYVLEEGTDHLNADLDALSAQAKVLRKLISEIRDDLFRYEGFTIEDVSDESASEETGVLGADAGENTVETEQAYYDTTSFQQGKVTHCINKGTVEADANVGGIVGQIATEYDLDPEDDITLTGTESFDVERTVKAVVRDSRNLGTVSGKKDDIGGVVGKADNGAIVSCESYGDVSSSSGNYVGGIAGEAGYTIRSCYAMNHCSGKNYVGGIAGKGCDIFYSYTYSQLEATGEKVGAIAGWVEDMGILCENGYVAGETGGVDGIGYRGGAMPITYEELCQMEQVPDAFSHFTVTFLAEGQEIASCECGYGDGIEEGEIPEIPKKEGYYGTWPDFDFENITGNKILEAQYEKWVGALESDETDETGRPQVLVEGAFVPDARLVLNQSDEEITFTITCPQENSDISEQIQNGNYVGEVDVRILCDDAEHVKVEVQTDGGYEQVDTKVMGSYLVFHMERPGTFRMTNAADHGTIITGVIVGCMVFLVLLIVLLRKRKKKQKG